MIHTHDQTKCRELVGASLPAFGDAGPVSRSKSLFLIRRWGNQVQRYSYRIPKSVVFSPCAIWFQVLAQVPSRSYC